MQIRYIFLLFILTACTVEAPEEFFDKQNLQEPIYTVEKMDSVLNLFETISFENLPEDYKLYADPQNKFSKKLKKRDYRIVKGDKCYLYIAGKNRISNFLCPDKYFTENKAHPEKHLIQYWLVDRQLLVWIIEFMEILQEKGYNRDGFTVRESHRHPHYNDKRGGATQSQHIFGTATDLTIQDINKDGHAGEDDKNIALEILEDIVGNDGGMGLYPGTMTIHIDTRGERARWNSYTRPKEK